MRSPRVTARHVQPPARETSEGSPREGPGVERNRVGRPEDTLWREGVRCACGGVVERRWKVFVPYALRSSTMRARRSAPAAPGMPATEKARRYV